MKPQDIKIGATYRNKGAGRTTRKVLDIADRPTSGGYRETMVLYEQPERWHYPATLRLKSFAAWAGTLCLRHGKEARSEH